MRSSPWRFACFLMTAVFLTIFASSRSIIAQETQHVVSSSDLVSAGIDASQTRQKNLDTLNSFFSSEKAKGALESAKIDPQQVRKAVAGLSDEELAQLAARAQKAQNDFAAGNIGDHDLLVILVVIAILILVIVAVH